ncbi:prolipoprotein diacylglyceryl transferase [Mycoplasma sp. CAG:877]|nr:prolipoprotein diacylglyceryl transferase [Mycoplasma sp. CAG:877]
MDRVALELGPIQIYWYSIFIFLGLLTASILIFKEARKRNIDEDFLINLIFNTIIIGLIGARVYYVLFNIPYYASNPIEILAVWNGGLAIHGGVFAALAFILIYCKKKNINSLQLLDIIVVGLIIAQAIGRWGNFFNSEAYGQVTTYAELKAQQIPTFIINGMYILGEYRQPTFFYESTWCFAGFLAMLIIRKYKYLKRGQLTGFYLFWYGLGRLLIESLRTDSLMLGPIKIAQVVSIVFIITGIVLFFYNLIKSTPTDKRLYTEDLSPNDDEMTIYFENVGDDYV